MMSCVVLLLTDGLYIAAFVTAGRCGITGR